MLRQLLKLKEGIKDKLELGNMDSYRDWGHSKDYVKAMHMIINHKKPDDFVVATGETHSVTRNDRLCILKIKNGL